MLEMYGIRENRDAWPSDINADEETDRFGRRCLMARRLLERASA